MEIVFELQEEHLEQMNIPLGHKLKIIKKIKELKPVEVEEPEEEEKEEKEERRPQMANA